MTPTVLADLVDQYLAKGDLVGFVQAVYLERIGSLFYVFLFLLFSIPLYVRTQSLSYLAILWILLSSILVTMLPVEAGGVGAVFLALGILVIFYKLLRR